MPDPAAFQQAFGALLAGRAGPAPGAAPDPALARALAIHRNTAAKAAQDALANNFPVVRALVGDEAFAGCAAAFVEAAAPASPRLCLYGTGFADVLADWPPFAELPWLADAARLERLVVEALFAADAEPLDAKALSGRFDPDLRLARHPAARVLASPAPVADLWRAHQEDAAADALGHLAWSPQTALVSRPWGRVSVQAIGRAVAAFLDALATDGATLGDAAAAAAAHGDLAEAFATLILAGALTRA